MSFPFYIRSPKLNRTINTRDSLPGNKHASASFATEPFNENQSHNPRDSSRSRGFNRMRIIPFLGKRRKSIATLRSSKLPERDEDGSRHGGHHKSVSQLANETAARFARSSLGAAGSRSTGNLELAPTFDASPFKPGKESAYATPTKGRSADARHTMLPSGSTQTSTPEQTNFKNKRASEKPAKASFLSRITSRPSLSARYSSADLKSGTKARRTDDSLKEYQAGFSLASKRKEIVHPVCISNGQSLGDDKDFFTSPRVAPTPPNLSFTFPDNSPLGTPLGPSQSTATLPGQKHGTLFSVAEAIKSPTQGTSIHANQTQVIMKCASSPTAIASPASLSNAVSLKSSRRHSVLTQDQKLSPETKRMVMIADSTTVESPTARPRGSHVRIGKEKVTISVANMLEAELGVEVGDSEDSSHYDDSYEGSRHLGNQAAYATQGRSVVNPPVNYAPNSSVPPSVSGGFGPAVKFPRIEDKKENEFTLESQSPLSALMSASSGDNPYSPLGESKVGPQSFLVGKADGALAYSTLQATVPYNQRFVTHAQPGSIQCSEMSCTRNPTSQACEIDRLDHISEKSFPLQQDTSRVILSKDKKGRSSGYDNNSVTTSHLQQALDVQCARFDKLAGHLLQIIQRHQIEKFQLESQIVALEKEARRNKREILALRKLITYNSKMSSQEERHSRRLVRVASMQSILSNISVNDEVVDISVVMDMLARASHRDSLFSPDVSKGGRASIDLSPRLVPMKAVKTDLRRSKTMPDLHKSSAMTPSPVQSLLPQDVSPDVSGLGLGLDFPLPEPLKLPSIASAIMSSAQGDSSSVPVLTTAPTTSSGLSLATEPTLGNFTNSSPGQMDSKPGGANSISERSGRKKRMAGEWLIGSAHGFH
ncbi:uncharacterized protein FOMMEDRAFT_156903 [Fomitiporia mediterranea MF3/22]|uniref:uncharacterized protein n=1 Tax=Fomitiporia mediterranea (strain MF3/22) TaxID=694068 RepID=UPI000440859B|nr:uncharacterized protein FOMMEDRAFT_156903 [Fomitiporia mediterranea MF3/22]EJD01778.1 hypothetical protein FOMMEDRAFT_156903 [Fomitiporia mediterranea MF3/22]